MAEINEMAKINKMAKINEMDEINEIDEKLKLTEEEIKKFGHMCYKNDYYNWIDYKNSNKPLNMIVKKHECGCKVITYDNYVGNIYSRNVYYRSRIILDKIIKVNNCEMHEKIVNERKKLLEQLQKLEDDYNEFIPRVVRKLNKNCLGCVNFIPECDIISQTVEL